MNKEFDFLGIKNWHEKGHFGEGVKIRLIDQYEDHIDQIVDSKNVIAPMADFKVYPITMSGIKQAETDDPDILIVSLNEFYGAMPYLERMIEKGTIVFKAAGNDDAKGEAGFTFPEESIFVAAYKLNNNNVIKTSYSSYGRGWVDIASLSEFVVDGRKVYGTSNAGPVSAYMYALALGKFINDYGYRIDFENAEKFLFSNTMDLEEDGKDLKSGHGLFVLPDNFDLNEYRGGDQVSVPKRNNDKGLLHWKFKKKLDQLLINVNARISEPGVIVDTFETVRSDELQTYYHSKGWAPYPIPTFHSKKIGLAADVIPYINGQPSWDRHDIFKIIGEEAVKLGLTWGGNWSTVDKPHVQLDDGLKSKDIRKGVLPEWFNDIDPGIYEGLPSWKTKGLESLEDLLEEHKWIDKLDEPLPAWAEFNIMARIREENQKKIQDLYNLIDSKINLDKGEL